MDEPIERGLGKPALLLYLAAIAMLAAHAPTLSTLAVIMLGLHMFARVTLGVLPERTATVRWGLLLGYVFTYFGTVAVHGLMPAADGAKEAAYVLVAYAAGDAIGSVRHDGRPPVLAGLLLPVAALSGFAYATVATHVTPTAIEIVDRTVPSIWSGQEPIGGTALGALASLGLCSAPAVVLAPPASLAKRTWQGLVALAACAVLAAAGLYVNVALQNRSPLVALALAAVSGVLLPARGRAGKTFAVMLLVAVFSAALVAVGMASDLLIFQRFSELGFESDRYKAWAAMLRGLWMAPVGGRVVEIAGLHYVHNAWLDVAWDAGMIPMALLLAFHASHLRPLKRAFRRMPSGLAVLVAGVLASAGIAFMVEPVMAISPIYFAMSCYFLALVSSAYGSTPSAQVGPARTAW